MNRSFPTLRTGGGHQLRQRQRRCLSVPGQPCRQPQAPPDRLRDYLDAEAQAGTLGFRSADGKIQPTSAVAEQFLGMICGRLL